MPIGAGSSPMTYQTLKLTYPIFDAEFDPYNRGYLVVCGGGGENRTGIPNKLTLLDVSSLHSISEVADLDLSIDEDSPQSLASLATKQGLITLAGVSSSVKDQKAGKNEHLRSYDVEFPPRKRAKKDGDDDEKVQAMKGARIQLAGKSSLFKAPDAKNPRAYQRVMKLSPVKSRDVAGKRIGAIATADAAENEIVLFDATTFIPRSSSVLQRLPLQSEAEDLDLCEYEEGSFGLAYCTNRDVYLYRLKCNFSKKTSTPQTDDPVLVHSISQKVSSTNSRIRSLRWMSPQHLLLLVNNQPGGAPELVVLHIDASTNTSSKVIQRKTLPKKMAIGVRLAVCSLDSDPASGLRQLVVAVAGQNLSIHLLTLDLTPEAATTDGLSSKAQVSSLKNFSVIDVSLQHDNGISALAFSNFFPPRQPADSPKSVASETQYIQLVSTSLGYTVSVETLALTSTPTAPALTSSDPVSFKSSNPSNRPSVRWVLSSKHTEFLLTSFGVIVAGVGILVAALLIQNYLIATSDKGSDVAPLSDLFSTANVLGSSAIVGASSSLSSGSSDASAVFSDVSSIVSSAGSSASFDASSSLYSGSSAASSVLSDIGSTVSSAASSAPAAASAQAHRLADLLHLHRHALVPSTPSLSSAASSASESLQNALHISAPENPFAHSDLTAELHSNAQQLRESGAKRFDELTEDEQERWKDRLAKAGRWTESEGVTVLKGVLFSEYAAVVGGAVRDAVLG